MSAKPALQTTPIPPEADRWNWGAFLLNWIWGLGNNTFVALLALVPFVGFVMMFVLGAKGSAWAWRNARWESVEHFRRVQRYWAIAGVIAWLAFIGACVAIFFSIVAAFQGSDVYKMGLEKLNSNPEAVRLLGTPIETGFPTGNFNLSGPGGEATLAIPVSGPKGKGTVYIEATKSMDVWRFEHIQLQVEGHPERIDLETGRQVLPPSPSDKQAEGRIDGHHAG
jgi:hypothetical protein